MRTKKKDRGWGDAPYEPWSEIAPGLWMGGHEYIGLDGLWASAVPRTEFHAVYSLHSREGHGPDPDIEHHVLEVPDDTLTAGQILAVHAFALSAARSWRDDRTVLVRCRAGLNRSGLVVAQVLMHHGWTVDDAVTLIRERRSPNALNNEVFIEYLTTGLELAAELTALSS